mmetsp:Transcript_44345/g.49470  ORF Transcript_44345/g.49470 Transcript_44345/m.49470 type:complete len:560 (+) Transcript_44345:209-1888(+)
MSTIKEKLTEDSFHLFGDLVIFSEGLVRLEYYQEFEDLYQNSNLYNNFTYGRTYNLSEMTEFLVILTQAARRKDQPPYLTEKDYDRKMSRIPKTAPLYMWSPVDWKNFRSSLTKIQGSMLRCDANASVNDIIINNSNSEGVETRKIDKSRSKDSWFTEKLLTVLTLFTFHEKFTPFREVLEQKISQRNDEQDDDGDAGDDETDALPLSMTKEFMAAYMQVIEEEEEDKIKSAFLSFLQKDNMDVFRSPSTIRRLLDDPKRPLSYAFLLSRVNKLIRSWACKVFERPKLAEIYNDSAAATAVAMTSDARALRRLQQSRARLEDHVEDPLPDVVVAATRARRKRTNQKNQSEDENDDEEGSDSSSQAERIKHEHKKNKHFLFPSESKRARRSPQGRGKLLEKKKTATRLGFTPEEGEESDDENIEDPEEDVLPQVKRCAFVVKSPSSAKQKKSQQKTYEGRRLWTDVEKNTVIEGIQNFGLGKWAEIKKNNSVILRNRTSGQIKDCFRTMKKKGEVGVIIKEAWSEKRTENPTTEKEEEEKQEEELVEEEKQEENSNNDNA